MNSPIQDKCSRCYESKCCTYITQKIDGPRSKADFEHLLWQISHQGVSAYKDAEGWFLLIDCHCTHLQENGLCGIYEKRPAICRDYKNEWCEYDQSADEGFKLYFEGYDDLLGYCQKRFKSWDV